MRYHTQIIDDHSASVSSSNYSLANQDEMKSQIHFLEDTLTWNNHWQYLAIFRIQPPKGVQQSIVHLPMVGW